MKIPKAKSLIVSMPQEHNYRIEEGYYTGVIHKIVRTPRPNSQDCGDVLRIVFALNVSGKEMFLNLAKAEFNLNLEHGSELRNVLTRLLGKETLAALSGKEINLESLVGTAADVQVEHVTTSKSDLYDYPFVRVCDIQPAGTLVTVKPADAQGQPK
jgi:chitinase